MLYFNYQNLSFGKKSQKNPVPKNEAEEKNNSCKSSDFSI